MTYGGTTLRSFLKWAGGKARSVQHIFPYIPDGVRFVDVFAGSGTVGLNVALAEGSPFKQVIFNDINYDPLDALYYAMSGAGYMAEAKVLFAEENANTVEFYNYVRRQFNSMRRGVLRAVMFLYLNRHAFNGLVRYNSDWEFNAPFGKYESVYFPEKELMHFDTVEMRSKATILQGSFESIMSLGRADGSVYYCDPPYLRPNGFTAYSGFAFGLEQHKRLAVLAADLAQRGATVLIQNHAEAADLYEGAEIVTWGIRHSISCVGDGRKNNQELLAIYRPH